MDKVKYKNFRIGKFVEFFHSLFPRNNIKITLLNVVYSLFLFLLFDRFIKQLFYIYGYDSWNISEFLINYQGGFVRRGLIGEILFIFANNFNINVEWIIHILCLISFLFVSIFFVRSFLSKGYSLYILPLCFFLGMGILACNNAWIRKDYLMLCFFIAIFWIFNKNNLSIPIKVFIINILAVFILLSHEVFAFFTLPLLFLFFLKQYLNKGILQSIVLSSLSLLPVIIVFLLTLFYHGNIETAQAIWDSWRDILNQAPMEVGQRNVTAISAIGWTSEYALKFHFRTNFLIRDDGIVPIVLWSIIFPIVYYISTNALFIFKKNENYYTAQHKTYLSSVLIFQLLCMSPVFVFLSCDWIRLFFYWITSSFTIFLLIPLEKIIFPNFFVKIVEKINDCLIKIFSPSKTTLIFFMMLIGIPPLKFSIMEGIRTSMLYSDLRLLSEMLVRLKILIINLFNFYNSIF